MQSRFIEALRNNQAEFDISLEDEQIVQFAEYFHLVMEHNPLFHLVAPCSPEEFAVRHVLESLTVLEFLPENARFADVGTGAGLPSVPCLIVRPDLAGYLIESKEKKAGFLQKALAKCKIDDLAEVINKQFSETPRPDVSYVTCRALDKFTQNLPRLIKWSGNCTLLLFGGPALGEAMRKNSLRFTKKLMPLSKQRYLFVSSDRAR